MTRFTAARATTLLDSGPGFDNLFGEEGNDTLTLANSDIGGTASGGEGDDILFGSDSSFSFFDNDLQGEAGNDELHAGAVGSTLGAGSGADRLFSSARDDQMDGGRDEFTSSWTVPRTVRVRRDWALELGGQLLRRPGFRLSGRIGLVRHARQRVALRGSDDRQRGLPDDHHVEPATSKSSASASKAVPGNSPRTIFCLPELTRRMKRPATHMCPRIQGCPPGRAAPPMWGRSPGRTLPPY